MVIHDPRVATAAQRAVTMRDGQVVDETRLSGGTGVSVSLEGLIQS